MPTPAKQRIDQLMLERGLAESRERAQALLLAGAVVVDGQRVDKPGHRVASDSRIEVTARLPYVGRGGLKLKGALEQFSIDPTGKVCLDAGASTGGFTDCLLQNGAVRVYAFDVGSGQLDWKLRQDPRVIVREGVNIRYLDPSEVPEPIDLVVCDVSFISVTMLLPVLTRLLRPEGEMVILVKPQFEVGREQVGKGGIVRDPNLQQAACEKVEGALSGLGWKTSRMESPILGAEGNREFLVYAHH
jgi:23S rRNA (cytidine1920-2'-O)/16S rRNA (cytidine1409-2'-O)-methyltransferase